MCRTQHEHILHEKSESVQLPRPRPLMQIAANRSMLETLEASLRALERQRQRLLDRVKERER
jgi:hypothetical protein